jgi:L-seryl-tRNA(Ser) seleniumtransferase
VRGFSEQTCLAMNSKSKLSTIPSIDRLLASAEASELVARFGHTIVVEHLRQATNEVRSELLSGPHELAGATSQAEDTAAAIVAGARCALETLFAPSLKPVFNLTGTVLHTNLGRAPMPEVALDAMRAAAGAVNVEMTLASGKRGDRDDHLEPWLTRLTGAQAATVVNNNAAAVLLTLNSLANRKQVPVSRGELIEIGGAFRVPDIMSRAGCKLIEVGTTNRTHPQDFAAAIGPRTAALMKVHTSNFAVVGFTAEVGTSALAAIAKPHGIPVIEDLGSGSLVDLSRFGLPHEPTAAEAISAGADVVTFSGDKLLGGPQCGIIVGRKDLIAKIKKNPLKRALRVDKVTIAALAALLPLHADLDKLAHNIPTLRLLQRKQEDIRDAAQRLAPAIAAWAGKRATVDIVDCDSQVGSGAMPLERLPSAAVRVQPLSARRQRSQALRAMATELRLAAIPVVCRTQDDCLIFDLRCIESAAEGTLIAQFENLAG